MRFAPFARRLAALALPLAALLLAACGPRAAAPAATPAPAADLPTFIAPADLAARLSTPEAARRLADLPAPAPAEAPQAAAALDAFAAWASRAETLLSTPPANPAARAALLAEAPPVLAARRQALRWLILHDPELALAAVASPRLRASLPPALAAQLETVLAGRADLLVDIACGLPPGSARDDLPPSGLTRTLVFQGREYRAFTHGRRLDLATKHDLPFQAVALDDLVALRGSAVLPVDPADPLAARILAERGLAAPPGPSYLLGDQLHAASSLAALDDAETAQNTLETAPGPEGAAADSPWTEGAKTLLCIRVAWVDSAVGYEPVTLATAQSRLETVDQFYRENSNNRLSLAATFTPTLRLPRSAADYGALGWTTLLSDARAAALAAGYPTTNYTLYAVASGSVPGFTWGGRAFVGGTASHIHNDFNLRVLAHEFGHNLGLQHANYNYTPSENPLSREAYAAAPDNSPSQGYGNRYDMMAASGTSLANHFSAREKTLLDWIPPAESPAVYSSGTYRVFRHDHPDASGLRALRAPSGDPLRTFFWLSHRRAIPGNAHLSAGAEFLWGNTDASSQSHLLIDTTPFSNDGPHADSNTGDNNDKVDAALTLGRMFGNPDNGAWFTILAQGGSAPAEWLDVAVELGNFSRNRPPLVALAPASATLSPNQSLALSATATDPDGNPLTLSWDFGDGTFAGDLPSVNKSWASSGHYVVRVVAVDRRGGTASARHVVRVGSPSTFTASGRVLDAAGLPVEGVRVHNGVVGSGHRGSRTDSDGRYTVPNLAAGSHTLSARKDGHDFAPVFTNPATLSANAADLDFVATRQPAPFVVVDNSDPAGFSTTATSGSWPASSAQFGFFGGNYLTDNNASKGQKTASFRPHLDTPGVYRLYLRYSSTSARATNVPVDIVHSNGLGGLATATLTVNQRVNGGTWYPLGTYALPAGPDALVRLRTDGTDGFVVADAVKFELATALPPTLRLSSPRPLARERGLAPATLRVEREGDPDPALLVHLAPLAVDGDTDAALATPGLDYHLPPASVSLASGAASADLAITPRADALAEGDELAAFTLLPPPGPDQLWDFNETSGAALASAANSVDGGLAWNAALADASANGAGALRIRYNNTGLTTAHVPLSPALSGTWHLVLETAGWNFSGTTASETVRFGFTTGVNNTITAQGVLTRGATGLTLAGEALGAGAAIPASLLSPALNTTTPHTFVVTVDATARTYRLSWRAGSSGPFTTLGTAAIDPVRALGALRLTVGGFFASATDERLDIGRITLTRADPADAPYFIGLPGEAFLTIRDDPRDDWRFHRFDSEQLADPALSAWSADPDRDGLDNFAEYALGLAPLVANASAHDAPFTIAIGDSRHLALRFFRRVDDDSLLYEPEASATLGQPVWPDTAVQVGEPAPAADPAYEEITVRDPEPLGTSPRRFLRVRVSGN
jgi:hypothetical protein